MRYRLFFTLDYEIHGNGDGNPLSLMVEPTERLMGLLEEYGQKLTIMADVAEILAFKRFYKETGTDAFNVNEIEKQLKDAVLRGHDVQLHIHSSWFNAHWDGRRWDQCIEDYNMAALPLDRIDGMIGRCVEYLYSLLAPVNPDYKVWLFRAANWSMMPTESIYQSLLKHGITADTSVYKGGVQGGNVSYDYREAFSNLLSYPADSMNINHYAPANQTATITEYPIYTEMRPFWAFISPIRLFRMIRARRHRHKHNSSSNNPACIEINKVDNRHLSVKSFFKSSPWKLDFNQATGKQLINAVKRIKGIKVEDRDLVDIILIGHSKSFLRYNEITLVRFLKWAQSDTIILKR